MTPFSRITNYRYSVDAQIMGRIQFKDYLSAKLLIDAYPQYIAVNDNGDA